MERTALRRVAPDVHLPPHVGEYQEPALCCLIEQLSRVPGERAQNVLQRVYLGCYALMHDRAVPRDDRLCADGGIASIASTASTAGRRLSEDLARARCDAMARETYTHFFVHGPGQTVERQLQYVAHALLHGGTTASRG